MPYWVVIRRDGCDRETAAGLLCREAEQRNAHADLACLARGAERVGHARKRLRMHAAAVVADGHLQFAVRIDKCDADMFGARRNRVLHDVEYVQR